MTAAVVELLTPAAVTAEVVAAFERLLPQLAPAAAPLGEDDLRAIAGAPGTTLFLARVHGQVVGSVTLVEIRIPSGRRARIESLVVDGAARGHGVGAALCRAAMQRALERGAEVVDLTSSPSRTAAHALYRKLGFEQRDTSVYRFHPGGRSS